MTENQSTLLTKANENFLNNYLRKLGLVNYKIKISSATNPGDNILGVVVRVKVVTGDSALHLIFKSALQKDQFRKCIGIVELYQRECYIYTTVLKIFEELQEENGILHPFKSYSKYCTHSLNFHDECLILEDLNAKSYKLQDRLKSMDYNHVMLVLQEYARFHALSFALRDQKPSLFEEIAKKSEEFFFCGYIFFTKEAITLLNDKLKAITNAFDVSQKSAYKKFLIMQRSFSTIAKNATQPKQAEKYSVICHGDCWTNNFLFQYSNPDCQNCPTKLAMIDWQLSRLGSPVLDLVHFLYTCTDKSFIDLHYDEAIAKYYKCFSNFLNEFGSDPEELFPYCVYQHHLKKFSIFGLYMAVQTLYVSLRPSDEALDISNISSKEESLKISLYKFSNSKQYETRIIDIVVHLDKLGYNTEI